MFSIYRFYIPLIFLLFCCSLYSQNENILKLYGEKFPKTVLDTKAYKTLTSFERDLNYENIQITKTPLLPDVSDINEIYFTDFNGKEHRFFAKRIYKHRFDRYTILAFSENNSGYMSLVRYGNQIDSYFQINGIEYQAESLGGGTVLFL